MENNEEKQHDNFELKENFCKTNYHHLLLVGLLAFLGSFLASYFLIHQVMIYHWEKAKRHNIVKYEQQIMNDIDKNSHKIHRKEHETFQKFKNKISAIQSSKYEDGYVIVIDLKHFNNDENNIRFNLNGNVVTVSGNIVKNKKNKENSYFFTETFEIPEKIDFSEIKKEKIDNMYIITLPIEN